MKLKAIAHLRGVLRSAIEARKLLPFAFILMLAFLVVMAWEGFASTQELLDTQAYVEHTHQVLHGMEGVEDGLQDAREAWLHYVLTPEKQDLENFDDSVARTWMEMDRLSALTKDDPRHEAKVTELQQWISDELRQLRADLRTNKTLLIYHSKDADFKRDRVRDAIEKFKANEETELRQRNEAGHQRAQEIERSVSIRIGIFSALMGVLFMLVMKESKKLRIAERTALLAQTKLEGSLLQLQSESENSRLLNDVQADLQICANATEAYKIAAAYLQRLMPGSSGTVYAIDNQRHLMEAGDLWGKSFCGQHTVYSTDDCCAVRGGRLHLHLEDKRGLSCRHFEDGSPQAYICCPLSALGETLSLLHMSASSPAMFTASRLALVQQIGEYTALRLANLKLRERLQDQSVRDPLTGLHNRRFLETTLEEILLHSGENAGTGIIMADLDGFKLFNDTFGHEAGDHVLREVAKVLRRCVRSGDIVCRYGGEEFLMVVPDSSPEGVCERAELMRSTISRLELELAGKPLGKVSASFGISFAQDTSLKSEALLRHADEALYLAKRSGCDCVRLSESVARLLGQPGQGQEHLTAMRPKAASAKRA
jgi:diguanylate cyclase (GGDEF)-like protein